MTEIDYVRTINRSRMLRPIVICGVARSGTRMATDLLNLYPSVAIQEEIHANTAEALFSCLHEIDEVFAHYSGRKGRDLSAWWVKSRSALLHSFFVSANKKGPTGVGKQITHHGVKTPGYERYFEEFERLFSDSRPHYVYCLRSVDLVWRSWKSMGYLTEVHRFRARYERSLRQALRIKRSAPDRLCIFELDRFVDAENRAQFLSDNLGSPLGITTEPAADANLVDNRNSIERRGKSYVSDPALEEEMLTLSKCPKISEYRARLLDR